MLYIILWMLLQSLSTVEIYGISLRESLNWNKISQIKTKIIKIILIRNVIHGCRLLK